MQIIRFSFLFIILLFFTSCQSKKTKKSYENNIETIEYIEPNTWMPKYELKLNKELEISNYKDSIYFGKLGDFLVDQQNNILIVERARFQIHKFSKNGEYIKSLGRQGRGPCECIYPGPLFFYDSSYYLLSQVPPKLINFDNDLNYINDFSLKNTIFWMFRNQGNFPTFFLIHERIRSKYVGFSRTFHTFNSLQFNLDSTAIVKYKGNDETKKNIRFVNYDVPKQYIIADDGKLWLNETTEYKIDLIKNRKKILSILIDLPLQRYTEEELKTYKEEIKGNVGRSIISQAGLQTQIGTLPEYHPAIKKIINLHDQIWVLLKKSISDRFYTIHVYNLNGNLEKIVKVAKDDFVQGNLYYRKDNFLYLMGEDDFNYTVAKYKMNFVKN